MIEIFDSGEYRVYVDEHVMVFRPRIINGSVLLLPPPSVKPQFYSILAVMLAKADVEVTMPRWHLPCNQSVLRQVINELLSRGNYDLVIMIGFDLGAINRRKLVIGFNGDGIIRQLAKSYVPGSVHNPPINDCAWIRDSVEKADLTIDEDLPSLNTIIRVRDLVLRLLRSGAVGKNNI